MFIGWAAFCLWGISTAVYAGPYAEVGAGYKPTIMPWGEKVFKGDNPTFIGRVGWEWDKHGLLGNVEGRWKVEFEHVSHWFDGPPVNDNYEHHLDQFNLMYKISW